MSINRKIITCIAAAGLVGSIGLGATAANAATTDPNAGDGGATTQGDIPVSVDVDPLAISQAIADAAKSAANRDGFVKDLSYLAYFNAGHQAYNVIVMNLSQPHDPSGLQGVVGYSDATYDGVVYGIWIFREGTFVNQGDGGWINWAAYGVIDRPSDGVMVFSPVS